MGEGRTIERSWAVCDVMHPHKSGQMLSSCGMSYVQLLSNMSEKKNSDSESRLLVIRIDDTPEEAAKSSLQKRSICSTPMSNRNIKRRRICDKTIYQSPLIHLGKTNNRSTRATSLDDSVIVLDEVTSLPESHNQMRQLNGYTNQRIFPDDSIIILSDNEGESETEMNNKQRNLQTVPSEGELQPEEITAITRKVTEKKTILQIPTISLARRVQANDKTKSVNIGMKSPEKKSNGIELQSVLTDSEDENMIRNDVSITSNQHPETKSVNIGMKSPEKKSNDIELQSVSIDSEDENTVPNDVSIKSNQEAEIVIVDNSPGIEIAEDVTWVNNSHPVADHNMANNKAGHKSTDSAKQGTTRSHTESRQCFLKIAQQLAALHRAQKNRNKNKSRGFCIDRKGDPSLRRLGKKSMKRFKKKQGQQASLNPNWANFVENKPLDAPLTEEPILPINQPVEDRGRNTQKNTLPNNQPPVNRIGTYYTEEAIVKAPGSLRDIVIDGCNVAMGYTHNKYFSASGLKLVVDYFRLKGHTVRVFIPQHMRCRANSLLETLYSEGIVSFTPSRCIGGRRIASYDDRFILDYALMCDGIVVSLDQYRDLYEEKQEWKNIIENRLLVPTFVGKAVMFPQDPLGRTGPKLDEFLRH